MANIGEGVLGMLQSPQSPPIESILTALINEIITIPDNPSTGSGQGLKTGFQTPSLAYGADFILQFDGVEREDLT